jgi:hypothetical protein
LKKTFKIKTKKVTGSRCSLGNNTSRLKVRASDPTPRSPTSAAQSPIAHVLLFAAQGIEFAVAPVAITHAAAAAAAAAAYAIAGVCMYVYTYIIYISMHIYFYV